MTQPRRAFALLAVVVQLAGLVAFAVWGWDTGHATVVRVLLALGTPLVGAIAWWAFCSDRARREMAPLVVIGVRLALCACAGAALIAIGQPGLAILVVFVAVAEALLRWAFTTSDRVAEVRG